MAAADDLWTAVKDAYDDQSLITLTNIRNRAAKVIDDGVGVAAAASVITYYPLYVQEDYDENSLQHVEVGMVGVIAMLWRRGGSATGAMKVKWEDWVELARTLKGVEPRGHALPETNSEVKPSKECQQGMAPCLPWSDRENFRHLLPGPPGARRDPTEWM